MSLQHLHVFLQPASVAVIGASSRPDSLGNWAWRNLVSAGFEGQLLPVNLKHKTLDGHRVYAHVADLPVVPDLALVCTPAATVSRVIDELGAHGTRAAVVLTDGLSPAQTAAMLKAARRYTLRIVGDHALGVQVPRLRLNAGIAPCMPMDGQLALVSQCGGVTASMLDWVPLAEPSPCSLSPSASAESFWSFSPSPSEPSLSVSPRSRMALRWIRASSLFRRFEADSLGRESELLALRSLACLALRFFLRNSLSERRRSFSTLCFADRRGTGGGVLRLESMEPGEGTDDSGELGLATLPDFLRFLTGVVAE